MEALNLYGAGDIRFEQSPKPTIMNDNEVIVRVETAGICGSDLSRYKKLGPYISGTTFGHECSGTIEEVGSNVSHLKEGMRVAVCPALPCGDCTQCRQGAFSRCPSLTVIGAVQPGAFAEYVKLPAENVLPLPNEIDADTAAFIEPAAVVAHGFYKTAIEPGADVAIIGCGSIGLLAIQWAKLFGARYVYAIDIDEQKLKVAKELGADQRVNPLDGPVHEQIHDLTAGEGVDVAIEAAGTPITSAQALALPKKGGEVVFLGIPYGDVTIERFYFEKIVRNELRVHGSWNGLSAPFPGKEWKTAIHSLQTGALQVKPLITHRLPLSDGPFVFKEMASGSPGYIKTLLYPGKTGQKERAINHLK
ncbi:galactitol-1-phosphate 5-dehydrogenase [Bacillus sp. FSL W8-1122]